MARDPLKVARWGLALRFAGLVALLLGVGGVGVFFHVRRVMFASFDASFDLAVLSVLESVERVDPRLAVHQGEFREEFEELNLTLGVVSASIWEGEEELAHASVHHERFAPQGPRREIRGGARPVVIRREPVGRRGVLVIGRRAGEIDEHLTSLRDGLLLAFPAGLAGALALGWLIARKALEPVQRAFEQQRAFMEDASHELRTPLAIIRTQAEVHEESDEIPRLRAALGQIARTTSALGRLVDDMLFLARSDAAGLPSRRIVVALEELIEEVLETFEPLAGSQGSHLVFSPPPAPVEVEVDPAQIQRLLGVLIDNALRHATPGRIEVHIKEDGPGVKLWVEDAGPGVPPGLRRRLLERFVRGPAAQERGVEGHGLGLAIARSIAQEHGGSLSLEQGSAGGLRALVSLPRRAR